MSEWFNFWCANKQTWNAAKNVMVDKAYYHCHGHRHSGDTDRWLSYAGQCLYWTRWTRPSTPPHHPRCLVVMAAHQGTLLRTTSGRLCRRLSRLREQQVSLNSHLVDWLVDWLVGGFVGGQTGGLVGGLDGSPVGGLVGGQTGWITGWWTCWLTDWFIGWWTGW